MVPPSYVCALMSRYDLSLPAGRRRAYLDYLWKDHAYLRVGFQNAHWISPELVRTNQPWPHQLKWWRDHGIKTVINLRGGFDGSFDLSLRDEVSFERRGQDTDAEWFRQY